MGIGMHYFSAEPGEAANSDMPESAIAHDRPIDLVAGVDTLASEISRPADRNARRHLQLVATKAGELAL